MVNDEEEKEMGGIETSCLLDGNFSEEESARYFQEALKQWRGERRNGKEQLMDATLPLKSGMDFPSVSSLIDCLFILKKHSTVSSISLDLS